jgi:hypothetical protein
MRRAHGVVVRIGDLAMLRINQSPIETTASKDGFADGWSIESAISYHMAIGSRERGERQIAGHSRQPETYPGFFLRQGVLEDSCRLHCAKLSCYQERGVFSREYE